MMTIALSGSRIRAASTVLFVLLAACASAPKVRVDKDASIDFASYKSFAWFEPQSAAGAPADQKKTSTLVSQRVRTSVLSALQAKGYALSEAQPDFRVTYVLNVYEKPKESGMRIGLGAGGGSGNVGGGVGLSFPVGKRTNLVGAMAIDIIDAKRNSQVWTGAYEAQVAAADVSDQDAQKLVATILEKFPSRPVLK
jgi:hypothetical protein